MQSLDEHSESKACDEREGFIIKNLQPYSLFSRIASF
jgi:hypothetical protein